MRTASPELVSYLDTLRAEPDAQVLMADCFTFTLRSGLVLTFTNADRSIPLNGYIYAANSVLVDGLKFKCSVGLDVDQQQITLIARPMDTLGGTAFLIAIRNGAFDGCEVQRDRAFLPSWTSAPIGAVTLFKGRVATVDQVGRTTAEITVNSDLTLLDLDMPRNLYQPACLHRLYDSGCGLVKNAFGASGIVGTSSTYATINWPGASSVYAQGTILFSSGANAGTSANIKSASVSALTLSYPLQILPAPGDVFTVYQGCDHTKATCQSKFNNLSNFRGFPFVPVPESAY